MLPGRGQDGVASELWSRTVAASAGTLKEHSCQCQNADDYLGQAFSWVAYVLQCVKLRLVENLKESVTNCVCTACYNCHQAAANSILMAVYLGTVLGILANASAPGVSCVMHIAQNEHHVSFCVLKKLREEGTCGPVI